MSSPRLIVAACLLGSLLAAATDYESELDAIRRFRSEEFLRIGVNDIHGLLMLSEVQEQLSDLAEVGIARESRMWLCQ